MKARVVIGIILYLLLGCNFIVYYFGIEYFVSLTAPKSLKIYVYDIDAKYNTDNIAAYKWHSPNIAFGIAGLGNQMNISEYAFDTNQFSLDIYFHYRLLHSSYITKNKTEADLFFIPWYPNLAKESGNLDAIWQFWDYFRHIHNFTFFKQNIHKHFMIYGGCEVFAREFYSQYSSSISNMSVVMLERKTRKNVTSKIIVAPYPGQVHFYHNRSDTIDFSKKDLLVSSAWNSRYPLRWGLADRCKKKPKICKHIDLAPNSDKYNHESIYNVTARSIFCMSPPGDSATRKAFYDALLVGCINVIYEDNIKYPFDDIFSYENMTVYIPMKQADFTLDILQKIPAGTIRQKQEYINKNRIHFQYTVPEGIDSTLFPPFEQRDAFHLLMDEIYKQSLAPW